MSPWIAGLSFVAANLGALELMGWAAPTYQHGTGGRAGHTSKWRGIWWGLLILAVGLFYCWHFQPRKTK